MKQLVRTVLGVCLGLAWFAGGPWVLGLQAAEQGSVPVIPIQPSGRPRFTIAVTGFPEFRVGGGGEDLGRLGHDVLRADLNNSSFFEAVEPAILPLDPRAVRARSALCFPV